MPDYNSLAEGTEIPENLRAMIQSSSPQDLSPTMAETEEQLPEPIPVIEPFPLDQTFPTNNSRPAPVPGPRASLAPFDPEYQGIAAAKGYRQDVARLRKIKYNHEAMVDMMIAKPGMSQNEIAAEFGLSPSWVSILINSDAFQAVLARRREEVIDPILFASVNDRLTSVAALSAEIVAEKLIATRSPDLALKALEVSTKALGFGARSPSGQVNVQNNFVVELPAKLANAQEWSEAHNPILEG